MTAKNWNAEAAAQAADDADEALAEAAARYNEALEALRIAKANAGKAGKTAIRDTLPTTSCLDAAYKIMQGYRIAIGTRRMVKEMAEQGLWKSPNGVTPWNTLSVEINREIRRKGAASRFVRGEMPGTYRVNPLLSEGA